MCLSFYVAAFLAYRVMLCSDLQTHTRCHTLCSRERYAFYALASSIVCYCVGNPHDEDRFLQGVEELDESACDMKCPGGGDDTCGGDFAMDIWEI